MSLPTEETIPSHREYQKLGDPRGGETDQLTFMFNYEGYDLVRKMQIPKGDYYRFYQIVNDYVDNPLTLNEWFILKNHASKRTRNHLKKVYEIDLDQYDRFVPWTSMEEYNQADDADKDYDLY